MKTFMSLLKTNLNVYFGVSALKYRFTKEKKRLWEPIAVLISIIIGGGMMVALYSLLLLGVFSVGQSMGQPEIVLTLAFVASQLFILIFGIFIIMSVFYFSNDMNILVPLPLKPGQVLASKFITILVSEYLIVLPMLLPALIIYGAGTLSGITYWIKGIILVLIAPIMPLVIAALFVVILMRFTNIRKGKDLMVVIGSLIGLFAGLGINFFMQNIPTGQEEEFFKNLIQSQSGFIQSIGNKFPPSIWATYGLSRTGFEGLWNFFLFIGFSLLLLLVLIWLGNHFFYKGYLSGQEVRRKSKALSHKAMKKRTSKASRPITALFWREWKLFFRTPIYVMNGLAGMIMVPFFMFMPLITKGEDLKELMEIGRNPEYAPIAALVGLGVILFASSLNIIACTAISREGSTFWMSRMIPVAPRHQVLAKLFHSMALSLLGLIIVVLSLYFVLQVSLVRLTAIIILGILGNLLINIANLMVDVLRPKLDWNDPQEAVKQNFNAFFGIIITFILLGILGTLSAILTIKQFPEWWVYIILAITIITLSIPGLYGLFNLADRRYRDIEV